MIIVIFIVFVSRLMLFVVVDCSGTVMTVEILYICIYVLRFTIFILCCLLGWVKIFKKVQFRETQRETLRETHYFSIFREHCGPSSGRKGLFVISGCHGIFGSAFVVVHFLVQKKFDNHKHRLLFFHLICSGTNRLNKITDTRQT